MPTRFCACQNCGTTTPLQDGHCICCHWCEGEPYFRPWWMPEDVWQLGCRTRWLPLKKKEEPLSETAQAIMDSIRNPAT